MNRSHATFDQVRGHSIWLLPRQDQADTLSGWIDQLSGAVVGQSFDPHVTLHGQVERSEHELFALIEAFAGRKGPIDLELDSLLFTEAYFRSIILAGRDEGSIHSMKMALLKDLDLNTSKPFLPHASLYYGQQNDDWKRKAVEPLNIELPLVLHLERVALVHTEGSVAHWREVASFDLRK